MSERKHLTQSEVAKLLDAVKGATHEVRDRCLLLLMYRHGLRVSEACGLKLSQVDLDDGVLHVQRLKGGLSTTHPLRSDEAKALKAWLVVRSRMAPGCDALFVSNRRTPINRRTVWVMLRGYGERFCRSRGSRFKSAYVSRLFKRPTSRTGWQLTWLCLVCPTALF